MWYVFDLEEDGVSNEQLLDSITDLQNQFSILQETLESTEEDITTEESTTEEHTTEEPAVIDLTFLGNADHNLYLSSEVEYANTNDVYSMLLSIRNILLLFMLLWASIKLLGMFKSALYRLMNK